ncbi:MAG: metallophosphoesterase [Clostridiales bacterium]|nr:metallophosphoesterase [Clostridiales bacterium]
MKSNRNLFLSFIMIVSMINTVIYWSMKPIWFFVNQEVGGFNLALIIWGLFLVFCVYSVILLRQHILEPIRKLGFIHVLLTIVWTGIFTLLNNYLYMMLGSEKHIVFRNIKQITPILLLSILVVFIVIFYPKWKLSRNFKISSLIALISLTTLLFGISYESNINITSGPYIQYISDEAFAVMWTTNENSTGFLEYGTDENSLEKLELSEHGLIQANTKVHKVIVPEMTDGMIFRVGSTDIKDYFQNNVTYGKTVYSDFISYEDNKSKDNTSFYVLSDVHERNDIYEKYLSKGEYDFLFLNGDILSSIDSKEIIVDHMLKPISEHTSGFKPFYFTRGNHETRGKAARELSDYLALPDGRYYYTFTYGPIFAVVLDTGEDKLDNHEEYGGLADFEAYREEETKWLEGVVASKAYQNSEYVIAFSHVPLNSYDINDGITPLSLYEEKWVGLLSEMSVDLMVSGHTHASQFIEASEDIPFPIMIGGGYIEANQGYEGIKITADEKLIIEVINEEGVVTNHYIID